MRSFRWLHFVRTITTYICGTSGWYLCHITPLVPTFMRWLLDFTKFVDPCHKHMSESVVTNVGTSYVEEWYLELDITLCLIHCNWMDIRALGFTGYKMLIPMYIGLLLMRPHVTSVRFHYWSEIDLWNKMHRTVYPRVIEVFGVDSCCFCEAENKIWPQYKSQPYLELEMLK